jgi:hypothetical protein
LESITLSDPFLWIAFWTGTAALCLAVVLAIAIIAMRAALARQRNTADLVDWIWMPLLARIIAGDPIEPLPSLRPGESFLFLRVWIHLQASIRGDAALALNEMAVRLGCDRVARQYLLSRNRSRQLVGVLVLGYLRSADAWPVLLHLFHGADSATSLLALWAMVRTDPGTALKHAMRHILAREDWPLMRLVTILAEAPELCSEAVTRAVPLVDPAHLPRALSLAEALQIALPPRLLAEMLRNESIDVRLSALRVVATPDLLPVVRSLADHPDWRVRLQVCKAIGRIGDESDLTRLQKMLGDPEWWVRYRAAQVITHSLLLNLQEVRELYYATDDRFGKAMLETAIAEGTAR